MECNRLGHTVHGEVSQNVATLCTRLFYAPAFERHLREFFHIKKFGAAQVIVPFLDPRIDAAYVDLCRHRRILGMLAINIDLSIELRELSLSCSKKLMHAETDH